MSYSELSKTDQLLTAVEFFAAGVEIPRELSEELGEDLIAEIKNPVGGYD